MSKGKVLVVDDDTGITRGTELRLRFAGYDTLTAGDGNDGISAAIEQEPDVILLDVRMPNRDGLSALETLRADERTARIPIIMVSASLRDRQTALDAGAKFFLSKPYRSADLLTAVESVLEGETRFQGTTT